MIMLTKLNDQKVMLNCAQIESVEFIPESKIVMMNGKFFLVKESAEEIIQKTIEYNAKFHCPHYKKQAGTMQPPIVPITER